MSVRTRSQGSDYLGELAAHLGSLLGIEVMANELVQNACDAGATWLSFDFRDEALVVENDSVFRDCGAQEEDECPWMAEDHGRCDFHRMRWTAGQDKRRDDAIGAFGIGFISVYQVTDRPELVSSDRKWVFRPEAPVSDRILEEDAPGCTGTTFTLPWATDPGSRVRIKLRRQPVSPESIEPYVCTLAEELPKAMIFRRVRSDRLVPVTRIELRRNGTVVRTFSRDEDGDRVSVSDGERTWEYLLLRGGFADQAARLHQEHPRFIEPTRRSEVAVAVPLRDTSAPGLFFAYLPTQEETRLPIHINADFFPHSDRKRLSFETDYTGQWNRAAVGAAADILSASLESLKVQLGYQAFWRLVDAIYGARQREGHAPDRRSLTSFWQACEPSLRSGKFAWTGGGRWEQPSEALLLPEDEYACEPALRELELHVVHNDLRSHRNVLLSLGSEPFAPNHFYHALAEAGTTKPIPVTDAPEWLNSPETYGLLSQELGFLARRTEVSQLQYWLGDCFPVRSEDGHWRPSDSLFRVDAEIRRALQSMAFGHALADPEFPPEARLLTPELDVSGVAGLLKGKSEADYEQFWQQQPHDLLQLLHWIGARTQELERNAPLRAELAGIPMWPSAGRSRTLTGLAVPGDFEDPLAVAALVDGRLVEAEKHLLTVLGAHPLTVARYAKEHVPTVFRQDCSLTDEQRCALVSVLSENLGKLQGDPGVLPALRECPIVGCTDDRFRCSREVYFDKDIVKVVLGGRVPIAKLPDQSAAAVEALYAWLGVSSWPRADDVVARVRALSERPASEVAGPVRRIFTSIGRNWETEVLGQDREQAFAPLRTLAWLPREGDSDSLHPPAKLYAAFNREQFETQGAFLDVDRAVQNACAAFMGYLGVEATPTPALVVAHLLECSSRGTRPNSTVYTYLENNADAVELNRLSGKRWLILGNGRFAATTEVFWGDHEFGRYRWKLDPDLRRYARLFQRFPVREAPNWWDALQVLKEVSQEHATGKRLDSEAVSVVHSCWRLLTEGLDDLHDGMQLRDALASLHTAKAIPNRQRLLCEPRGLLFDDRPDLASRFGPMAQCVLIPRMPDSWPAMAAAGLQSLGRKVTREVLSREGEVSDEALSLRLRERKSLIERVVEAEEALTGRDWDLGLLDRLTVRRSSRLVVRYILAAFGHRMASEAEQTSALLDPETGTLDIASRNGIPWSAIARELAQSLKPEGETGTLASGIKVVLEAETPSEATGELDDLGYAAHAGSVGRAGAGETVGLGAEQSEDSDSHDGGEKDDDASDADLVEPEADTSADDSDSGDDPVDDDDADESAGEDDSQRDDSDERGGTGAGQSAGTGTTSGSSGGGGDGQRGGRNGQKKWRWPDGTAGNATKKSGIFPLRVVLGDEGSEAHEGEGNGEEAVARRNAIDEAGIQRVLWWEHQQGRGALKMGQTHEGYDIEAYSDERCLGEVQRYIEVKSRGSLWGDPGVGLTGPQWECAQDFGDRFWLYVVENAESDSGWRLHCIQDPAGLANRFYFNGSWEVAASEHGGPIGDIE